MKTELWGHIIDVPEPLIVGVCCGACGGDIYDYELTYCPGCDIELHRGCVLDCAQCGEQGCKMCMVNDGSDWYCNSSGPNETNQSECREERNA